MEVKIFQLNSRKKPYDEWLDSLESVAEMRIRRRIARVEEDGHLGDFRNVGDEIFELKFNFGSGYRVYFAYEDEKTIILLYGGKKDTQKKDIAYAKKLWSNKGE